MTTEREHLGRWIEIERDTYANAKKYGEGMPGRVALIESMASEGYNGRWSDYITSYLRRVELFGVDSPQGRQAMGKTITTLMHCLETAILTYGPMPEPGQPSGEIGEWKDG